MSAPISQRRGGTQAVRRALPGLLFLLLAASCTQKHDGAEAPLPFQTHSVAGCQLWIEKDGDADGTADDRWWYRYDDGENLTRYVYKDSDGDRSDYSYRYDGNGCMVWADVFVRSGDSQTHYEVEQSCDALGWPVRADYHLTQQGGACAQEEYDYYYTYETHYDGTLPDFVHVDGFHSPRRQFHCHYDDYTWEDGRMVGWDLWEHNAITRSETWSYDEQGNELTHTIQDEELGTDYAASFEYDAWGRRTASLLHYFHYDRDYLYQWVWDPDWDRVTRESIDYDADGVEDKATTYAYSGDWPWSEIQWEDSTDPAAGGAPDTVWTYDWACPGGEE